MADLTSSPGDAILVFILIGCLVFMQWRANR
jgi:hypothetical protein